MSAHQRHRLSQGLCLHILGLAKLPNLPIILLDLGRHFRDLLQHRTERWCQSRRQHGQAALGKTCGGGSWHAVAAGLGQSAYSVHGWRREADYEVTNADQVNAVAIAACDARWDGDWLGTGAGRSRLHFG